jgi:uncharacterized protein (DUF58 family)
MENLVWILPLLVCPLGMLLMGAVVWLAAKLGLRSSERSEEPAGVRDREGRSAAAPEAA